MHIDPQYTLPLVYQIVDPSDSTVYYIRGVIRDSLTGTIIETKNLTSQGSGRYTTSTLAPKDPTGQGRHIDVVITVYTDAAYTVVSDMYQKQVDRYLVKRSNPNFGGSGADEIDYEKVGKIVDAIIVAHLKPVIAAIPEGVSLTGVLEAIGGVRAVADAIEAKEDPEAVDLKPLIALVETKASELSQKIDDKEVTEVDLAPVLEAIGTAKKDIVSELSDKTGELVNDVLTSIKSLGESLAEVIGLRKKAQELVVDALEIMAKPPKEEEKKEPEVEVPEDLKRFIGKRP